MFNCAVTKRRDRHKGERAIGKADEHPRWMGAFGWVLTARGGAALATVAGIMLMGRTLGPAQYGQLVLLLTMMKVSGELFGPALDTGLVRFESRDLRKGSGDATAYLRAVLWMKLVLIAATLAVGAACSAPLHTLLFRGPAGESLPRYAVFLAFLGGGITMLWALGQAHFQACQEFRPYARFEFAAAAIRFVMVAGVAWLVRSPAIGASNAILLFLAAYVASIALAAGSIAPCLPREILRAAPGLGVRVKEVLVFTKWVFAACCFTSVAHRLDIMLVNYLGLDEQAIGDYAGAVNLVLLGDLVILTLFNVLLPKASELKSRDERTRFLLSFRGPALAAAAAMVPVIALSGIVSRVVFGPAFVQTGVLLGILLVGTYFSLGSAPAGTLLYGMGKSHVVAGLEGAKLVGILVAGSYMASRHGVFGMAWTMAAVKGTIGIVTVGIAHAQVARESSA